MTIACCELFLTHGASCPPCWGCKSCSAHLETHFCLATSTCWRAVWPPWLRQASTYSLSQDLYARAQEAGGLRFYRLRDIMREYRAGLLRVADFAPSIFAATMAEAEKYYPIEEGMPAAAVAAAPAAARAAAAAAAAPAAPAVSAGAAPALLRSRGGNEITVVGMRRWSQGHTEETDLLKVCFGEE